ncbi:MAG: hypothetical protein ABIW84_04570 [Ilumatobacteraceae bacterium]
MPAAVLAFATSGIMLASCGDDAPDAASSPAAVDTTNGQDDEGGEHDAASPVPEAIGGFRAAEPGRYAFYCSIAGHRDAGMEGMDRRRGRQVIEPLL